MEKPSSAKWINLGCGDDIRKDFENVDCYSATGIDTVCNLNDPVWPWPNNYADFILALDIIEHLPNKIRTMNNIWTTLKNGGQIIIEVPTTDGPGAFQDPTHISYWNRNSFWYYEKGNVYYERFHVQMGICACFEVLSSDIRMTQDGPKLRIQLKAIKCESALYSQTVHSQTTSVICSHPLLTRRSTLK